MIEITVYSKENCPYCVRAKQLLNTLAVDFTEVKVDLEPERLTEMLQRSGRRTVPQIFINGQSIGGFDDLYMLYQTGKLQSLLESDSAV